MLILRHHMKKKKTNSSLRRISKINLVKAVQTDKQAKFLVQISAFVGLRKLPGIPMLTALTET